MLSYAGNLCVLDGVHALDTHALGSLRRLLQDSVVDLPSGERLNCHPSFRVIALGLPASKGGGGGSGVSLVDSRMRYIASDLGWTYHALAEGSSSEVFQLLQQHVGRGVAGAIQKQNKQQHERGIVQLSEVLHNLSETAGVRVSQIALLVIIKQFTSSCHTHACANMPSLSSTLHLQFLFLRRRCTPRIEAFFSPCTEHYQLAIVPGRRLSAGSSGIA